MACSLGSLGKRGLYGIRIEQQAAASLKAGNPPGLGFGSQPSQRQTKFIRKFYGGNVCSRAHTLVLELISDGVESA